MGYVPLTAIWYFYLLTNKGNILGENIAMGANIAVVVTQPVVMACVSWTVVKHELQMSTLMLCCGAEIVGAGEEERGEEDRAVPESD